MKETHPQQSTLALVGPMGAGKTAVGRRLARLLGRPFYDTDEMVEKLTGKNVSEIFAKDGEAAFRTLESEAVKKAVEIPRCVVACGGGAVLDPSNVTLLRSTGLVVYLKPSLHTALRRVGSGQGRPLLEGGDVRAAMRDLFEAREPVYLSAAHHVVPADADAHTVARAVLETVAGGSVDALEGRL